MTVYETYHPIPDYGNLLIFYLTQALAWELPSQPYHPEEHLQDLFDDVIFPDDQYDDISANNQVADAAANNLQNSIQEKNSADRNNNLNTQYFQDSIKNGNQQGVPLQNQNPQGLPLQNQNPQGLPLQNQNPQAIPLQNPQGVQIQNRNGDQGSGGYNYYSNNYNPTAPNKNYYSNYQNKQKVSDLIKPLTKTISNKMDYYLSYADKVLNQITNFGTEKHTPWKKADWTSYPQRFGISPKFTLSPMLILIRNIFQQSTEQLLSN